MEDAGIAHRLGEPPICCRSREMSFMDRMCVVIQKPPQMRCISYAVVASDMAVLIRSTRREQHSAAQLPRPCPRFPTCPSRDVGLLQDEAASALAVGVMPIRKTCGNGKMTDNWDG
jgi:hypothetical protein